MPPGDSGAALHCHSALVTCPPLRRCWACGAPGESGCQTRSVRSLEQLTSTSPTSARSLTCERRACKQGRCTRRHEASCRARPYKRCCAYCSFCLGMRHTLSLLNACSWAQWKPHPVDMADVLVQQGRAGRCRGVPAAAGPVVVGNSSEGSGTTPLQNAQSHDRQQTFHCNSVYTTHQAMTESREPVHSRCSSAESANAFTPAQCCSRHGAQTAHAGDDGLPGTPPSC